MRRSDIFVERVKEDLGGGIAGDSHCLHRGGNARDDSIAGPPVGQTLFAERPGEEVDRPRFVAFHVVDDAGEDPSGNLKRTFKQNCNTWSHGGDIIAQELVFSKKEVKFVFRILQWARQ